MPACKILDNHMCITVNAKWRPCCRFNEHVQPWSERMSVDEYTFDDYRNSDFYKSIKAAQETGWHEGCNGCKVAEETGNISTRLLFDKALSGTPNQVEYIELSLSNECNLACRMCGPWASSTWSKLVSENEDIIRPFQKLPLASELGIDFLKLVKTIDLSKVTSIKLLGGEPFITPQTTDFLKYLEDNNIIGNIELQTNTNATFFPKKLEKYLTKFRHVAISLSFDGVGAVGEYIRHKSKWEDTLPIIHQWKEFYRKNQYWSNSLKFASVINAYNVHHLPEMVKFSKDVGIPLSYNIINGPNRLRLEALPPQYVNDIKERLNTEATRNVYKYLEQMTCNENYLKELAEYTNTLDEITQTSLKNVNPLLAKYLDKL